MTAGMNERVYAVIAKNSSGSWYNIRLKYPSRADGNALYWPSELYGDHYRTRQQAEDLVKDRGWIKVTSWKQARSLEKQREKEE